jgi:hypothetical protein
MPFHSQMCFVCGLPSCKDLSEQFRDMGDARGPLHCKGGHKKIKSTGSQVEEKMVGSNESIWVVSLSQAKITTSIIVFRRKQILQPRELYQSTNQPLKRMWKFFLSTLLQFKSIVTRKRNERIAGAVRHYSINVCQGRHSIS